MQTDKITIVLICHKRVWHLEQVLSSLSEVNNFAMCDLVIVAHAPSDEVIRVLESYAFPNLRILVRRDEQFDSTHHAINSNVHFGLMFAFNENNSDFVILLEDDIVPSVDFIDYFRCVFMQHRKRRKFRGINGFSKEFANQVETNSYVRLQFGLGWGWGIPRSTFTAVKRYWTGDEDEHWDFIFEPYVRTGYVLNPIRSRILNIGFDESATHTGANQQLGESIKQSFLSARPNKDEPYTEIRKSFGWDGQVGQYSFFRKRKILVSHVLSRFLFRIYLLPKCRKYYVPIKRRLRRWTILEI